MNELPFDGVSEVFDNAVHIHWHDVPMICDQSAVLGSNGVDFFDPNLTLTNHNIDTLFMKPFDPSKDRYDLVHDSRKTGTRAHKYCRKAGDSEKEVKEQETSPGIIMILEAEDATAQLDSIETVKDAVVKGLEKEGLHVVSVIVRATSSSSDSEGVVLTLVLAEGYVTVRTWPEHKYCAFDIHLWGSFEKHEAAKTALVTAVGSSAASMSSYRIVAGGMFGVSTWRDDAKKNGPQLDELCGQDSAAPESVRDAPTDPAAVDTLIKEGLSFLQDTDVIVAVVCGNQTQECRSLDVVNGHSNVRESVALRTCSDIQPGDEYSKDGRDRILACEKDTIKTLQDSLSNNDQKVGAIILDSSAPHVMGQIVYKIVDWDSVDAKIFTPENILAIAMIEREDEEWRRYLLDRLRRDIVNLEPVFRAEILFNSSDSSVEMGVTLSGDSVFVQHLADMVDRIEKQTGLTSNIRNIHGGLWDLPDSDASQFFLPKDYDRTSPLEQWRSQQPLGLQTVFQLETVPAQEPVLVGDRIQIYHPFDWFDAVVVSANSDGTYDIEYDGGDFDVGLPRKRLHKLESVSVGEKVLADFNGNGEWFPATIVSENSDGSFNVEYHDGDDEESVSIHQIRKISNTVKKEEKPRNLTKDEVKDAFKHTLASMKSKDIASAKLEEFTNLGDGCVLAAVWPEGNVVVLWDGRKHVDINLFTYAESVEFADEFVSQFKSTIPLLEIALRDEQPRGFGRVVNFLHDIEPRVDPHWAYE